MNFQLFQVVVDDDETAQNLIEKGSLRKRVTFIPLSKVKPKKLEDQMIRRAKSLVGNENVDMALSLVVAEKNVQKAIDYVLGDVFICNDMDAAKRVTFDPQIRRKSVTLDGQTFDPAGTLRGGTVLSLYK